MTAMTLPLQSSLWSGALRFGAALGRSGLAARRRAKAKLHALERAAAAAAASSDPARQAAAVRELAATYLRSDPGYAEDLYAAASRHEREHARSA